MCKGGLRHRIYFVTDSLPQFHPLFGHIRAFECSGGRELENLSRGGIV